MGGAGLLTIGLNVQAQDIIGLSNHFDVLEREWYTIKTIHFVSPTPRRSFLAQSIVSGKSNSIFHQYRHVAHLSLLSKSLARSNIFPIIFFFFLFYSSPVGRIWRGLPNLKLTSNVCISM